ncbi:3264_t:CDS:2 [Ambispora gerdemannii]|uniref:3264_t:CDS:1 n=1 Tax=Ambispora gerdemannii TaxID=144530 RepID=A0A9N8YSL2_9GLOM|nr:3264_t:CDS:2 [Ambispora gerdemannii]
MKNLQHPQLSSDILKLIFSNFADPIYQEELVTNPPGHWTLYNCMLVNKAWSKVAVQLLWQQPFKVTYSGPCYKVLDLLLPRAIYEKEIRERKKQSKQKQQQKSILMRYFSFSRKKKQQEQQEKPTVTNLMFNYSSFIQKLEFNRMVTVIYCWTEKKLPNDLKNSKEYIVLCIRLLFELFLNNGVQLKSLYLSSSGFFRLSTEKDKNCNVSSYLHLLLDSSSIPLLENIHKLWLKTKSNNEEASIAELHTVCKNVKFMNLDNLAENDLYSNHRITIERFVKLIGSQKQLTSLTISYCLAKKINDILKIHSSTLRRIKFISCDFLNCRKLDGLASCINLEKMEFYCCTNLNAEMLQPVFNANFKKLRLVILLFSSPDYICEEFRAWATVINETGRG